MCNTEKFQKANTICESHIPERTELAVSAPQWIALLFCESRFFKKGCILRWLERLAEIDNQ